MSILKSEKLKALVENYALEHKKAALSIHEVLCLVDKCPKENDQSYLPSKHRNDRILIPLPNGLKLIAQQNDDSLFCNEIFIGLAQADGSWLQDLAIVRQDFQYGEDGIHWSKDKYEVLVYGDENDEDYTHRFEIGTCKEE